MSKAQLSQGEPTISTEHGPWVPSTMHEGETHCQRCKLRSVYADARKCEPHISTPPAAAEGALTYEQIERLARGFMEPLRVKLFLEDVRAALSTGGDA